METKPNQRPRQAETRKRASSRRRTGAHLGKISSANLVSRASAIPEIIPHRELNETEQNVVYALKETPILGSIDARKELMNLIYDETVEITKGKKSKIDLALHDLQEFKLIECSGHDPRHLSDIYNTEAGLLEPTPLIEEPSQSQR